MTNFFVKRFRSVFFFWEVTIMVRKLLVVICIKFFTKHVSGHCKCSCCCVLLKGLSPFLRVDCASSNLYDPGAVRVPALHGGLEALQEDEAQRA